MAARKTKKTASSSRTPSKSPSSGAAKSAISGADKKTSAAKPKNSHNGEIIVICAIAASILLGIGIYTQSGGVAGRFVDMVFKGLFGVGATLIPLMAAWAGIVMILRKFEKPRVREICLVTGLFLCVCIMAHVFSGADYPSAANGVGGYISSAFSAGATGNGGLLGAVLGDFLQNILGAVGTYIVIIAVALVFTILLTDKSIIQGMLFGIEKAKSLRHIRRTEAYEEYEDEEEDDALPEHSALPKSLAKISEADKPKIPFLLKDPKKATVTIEEPVEKPRLKILLFNEPGDEEIENSKYEPEIDEFDEIEPETSALHRPELDDTGIWQYDEPPFDADDYIVEEEEDRNKEEHFVETAVKGELKNDAKSDIERLKEQLTEKSSVDTPHEQEPHMFPPIELLDRNPSPSTAKSKAMILENSRKLEETLKSFGVEARVVEVSKGPTVTRYELSPGHGVKVSKIASLSDDLALNLAAVGIRIEAPIPGKAAVGIEIPNKEVTTVYLREVIEDEKFIDHPSKLAFALGKDIAGNTVVADIARMPHLLIAGATGSGKSVCVNTLITSLLFKADPREVKIIMIDPKVVELGVYNGIPHLLIPVVTDPRKAAGALNWAVQEMITRYNLFAEASVRDLKGYNTLLRNRGEQILPQIVIIIDELADLMMVAPGEVEDAICRLAQMARAAGLHLIIATQRPSVDVITGLIKANIPSRLAFAVSSGIDSRTILDTIGAEKLLGKGDMLFYPVGLSKPQRVQGALITDKEVENIVAFIKNNSTGAYDQDMISRITSAKTAASGTGEVDELFIYAAEFIIEKDKASASMLQRQFRIGYNKAARLIEELEERGIVGPEDGSKPRKVLMNSYQWEEYKGNL